MVFMCLPGTILSKDLLLEVLAKGLLPFLHGQYVGHFFGRLVFFFFGAYS
jgi:hypothetical protein